MNTQLALLDQDEMHEDHWSEAGQFDGFGALETPGGVLPLKAMDVQGKVAGLLAHIAVEQTFVNVFDRPLEATYIFPLPPQAAVTSFRMEVASRVVRGVLQERGQARQVYQEAIASGQRAAIAEEERADVFSMQVGNLLPQEQATLRLTMTFPLSCRDGEVTFRFPLVVAPRYIPGQGLDDLPVGDGVAHDTDAVPDASRISPPVLLKGYPNPIQLALSLEIDAGDIPLRSLRSSLHSLLVGTAKRRYLVSLQPGERLDRDFLLRYDYGGEEIVPALQLAPDHTCRPHWEQREAGDFDPSTLPKDTGTFALTLTPPRLNHATRQARDIVFVLDRSGSMSGWKMVVARRAVAQMIDTLHPRDQFQILAFDDRIEMPDLGQPEGGMVRARRQYRLKADDYLSTLDSRGGTEMAEPLQQAAKMLNAGAKGRERVMVLVTDGQVGNEDQILRSLREDSRHLRIFTLGIDTAVNAGFLERLALQGGGACELVESEDRLEEAFARIQRLIETPVLSDLAIELEGLSLVPQSLSPGRLPDLFEGVPLCIMGRYQGAHEGSVTLTAKDAMGNRWRHRIFGQSTSNPSIPTIWARQQIRKLEDEIASGSRSASVVELELLATSLQFGVLSRFTAFVAVDQEKVVQPGTPTHQVVQAVEAPSGWTVEAEVQEEYKECEEYEEDAPDELWARAAGVAKEGKVSGVREMGSIYDEKAKDLYDEKAELALAKNDISTADSRFKANQGVVLGRADDKPVAKPVLRRSMAKPKPALRQFESAVNGPVLRGKSGAGGGGGFGAPSQSAPPPPPTPKAPAEAPRRVMSVMPTPKPEPAMERPALPSRGRTEATHQTQAGVIKGAFLYLSPEQVKGQTVTQQSDQFALGQLIYELLTGTPLFARDHDFQTLQAILSDPLPSPLLREPAQQAFVPLLQRLLQRDPADRFDNLQQAYDALVKVLDLDGLPQESQLGEWLELHYQEEHAEMLAQVEAAAAVVDVPEQGYLLLTRLSSDGVSETWLAVGYNAYQERRVHAIRVALSDFSADHDWLQSFVTEGQFVHNHALALQEIGVTETGEYYQVYPFVPGMTLKTLCIGLRQKGLVMPLALASQVIQRVAQCLLGFHDCSSREGISLGIAHGSLSPEHVWVGFDGGVYVRQFGPMPADFQGPIVRKDLHFSSATTEPTPAHLGSDHATSGLLSRLRSFFLG